ncbi:uncharacterized protein LOC142774264 [Rhipicephalus microplus]|uniref:uncharacterized protein LOC142774264 n=1 Tax=Rhipicephalus microplus TaxID=6941 RepID=UPI003F6B64A6
MAFTVVLLSELNAIEAHLYQKVLPQRVVDNQPEVLQQRLLPKSVMSSYDARYKADQKKSVKCVYFTKWPPHAYCNVLSTNRHKRLSEAENDCRSLKVALTNMATTPMYRICRLIRLFGIEDQRIWVEDILYQPDTISWEDCFFWVENETTPPAECGTCNVSVICQGFY